MLIFALMSFGFLTLCAAGDGNRFKASGDISIDMPKADSSLNYMKRINIWKISITTPRQIHKKTGRNGSIHLFFSRDFTPSAKTYPIAFSYLNKKDTMGGTFFHRVMKERTERFTHDTKGEITFSKVGDLLEGSFSFTVYQGSKAPRKSVTVKGTFSVPKAAGFPAAPPASK
ncbi:MAG: hypothetical protein GY765_07730 [bacterium]|nr:hypothetical protein [bacterium]